MYTYIDMYTYLSLSIYIYIYIYIIYIYIYIYCITIIYIIISIVATLRDSASPGSLRPCRARRSPPATSRGSLRAVIIPVLRVLVLLTLVLVL